jgi:hypothetical protein
MLVISDTRMTKMLINCDEHKSMMILSIKSQDKKEVLFLCTHNSARSQMAEGLLRAIYGDRYEAYSAGVKATSVDPRAVLVMKEIGEWIIHTFE